MADPLPDLAPEHKPEPKYNTADYIAFGCLTTVVSLVLAAAIIALLISTRTFRADLFRDAVGPAIDNAPMIADHKQQLKDDLDQVLEAYRAEQFEIEELQELAQWFSTSEYLIAGAVYGLGQEQVLNTSWPTAEKLRAQQAFTIYAHLVLAGAIDEKTNERIARKLQEESPRGGWSWVTEYNDALLQTLLDEIDAQPAVVERLAAMEADEESELPVPDVPTVIAKAINARLNAEVIKLDSAKQGDGLPEAAIDAEVGGGEKAPAAPEAPSAPESPAATDGPAANP